MRRLNLLIIILVLGALFSCDKASNKELKDKKTKDNFRKGEFNDPPAKSW